MATLKQLMPLLLVDVAQRLDTRRSENFGYLKDDAYESALDLGKRTEKKVITAYCKSYYGQAK